MGTFGYNLRKLRELRGLSPEQMAEKTGLSVRTYLKNEAGEREMTRIEMKAAAKTLEVPEEMMMSLGERSVFNSFNNHQDGDNNHYSSAAQERVNELSQRITHLEGKVEMLAKLLLKSDVEQ